MSVPYILWGLALALAAALGEEVFFRGITLSAFRRYGDAWGVAASTVLFTLIHMRPSLFIALSFVGVLLGVLAIRTGSIWTGALIHAFADTLTHLFRAVPMEQVSWAFHPAALAIQAVVGAWLLYRFWPRRKTAGGMICPSP